MAARVIGDVPGSPDRLRFTHVLIRDALYEGLTTRAPRLCCTAGSWTALEQLYGDEPGAHLAELAHHAIAGGEFARGGRYAHLAGDRALALSAYEEAARLYQIALDAARARGRAGRARPLRAAACAGRGRDARGRHAGGAGDVRRRGRPRAARSGWRASCARAAAGYGGRIVWSRRR